MSIREADTDGIPMHCLAAKDIDVIEQIAAAKDWDQIEQMAGRFK
jgi:hypothetical protein